MKKKLLSIMLMVVMVLSVAACGKKASANAQTVTAILENISKAEVNTVSMEFEMAMEDEALGFRITSSAKDEANAYASVEMKMDIEGYEMKDYVELTNIYVVDTNTIYIDINQVLDFLTELDSQFAMFTTYFNFSGDYLVITMDDLKALYESMGMDTAEIEAAFNAETDEEFNKQIINICGTFLDEYVAKAGDAATIKDGKVTFTINNDNIVTVMDALSQMDVEDFFLKLAEAIDKQAGTVETTASMKAEVDGMNDSIKEAATILKENGVGEGKMDMTLDMGMDGNNVVMNMNFVVESDGEKVTITLDYKATPDKAKNFEVPTSTMSLEDFMALMNGTM